jgi:hypothetical protein
MRRRRECVGHTSVVVAKDREGDWMRVPGRLGVEHEKVDAKYVVTVVSMVVKPVCSGGRGRGPTPTIYDSSSTSGTGTKTFNTSTRHQSRLASPCIWMQIAPLLEIEYRRGLHMPFLS